MPGVSAECFSHGFSASLQDRPSIGLAVLKGQQARALSEEPGISQKKMPNILKKNP